MSKTAQTIVAELAVGVVGFALSVVWGKTSGRDMDRDTYKLLAIMWGAITLIGIFLVFVM